MKKLQLLGFVCLFFILFNPVVFGEGYPPIIQKVSEPECDFGADIYLEFEALDPDFKIPSKYQFPKFKEDDYLVVKKLRLNNTGTCTLTEPTIEIILIPLSGKTKHFFSAYGLEIPHNITVGEVYNLERSQLYSYTDNFGGTQSGYPIILDELGKWQIEIEVYQEAPGPLRYVGFTDFIHGSISRDSFRVYTLDDLRAKEKTDLAIWIAIASLIAVIVSTIAVIVSTIAVVVSTYFSIREQRKQGHNLEPLFNRLFGYQKDISRKIEKLNNLRRKNIRKK